MLFICNVVNVSNTLCRILVEDHSLQEGVALYLAAFLLLCVAVINAPAQFAAQIIKHTRQRAAVGLKFRARQHHLVDGRQQLDP